MKIEVSIGGVDGENNVIMYSANIDNILDFLKKYDHEGSSITVIISAYDEEVYTVLTTLKSK